ncbi:bifunctional glucose-1-phosphatase/inositol phosphatase [Rouxiella sp. WC2420]|uniref:Bifunctional glucose-1-phosphatase/inositol phosphatase n=1 Tax=Rouxiella sp. WC2420 TaxID=3234145 RepID=A0AB39VQ08_9GAMM
MKRSTRLALLTTLACVISSTLPVMAAENNLELEQVLIFSRHSIRAPLANYNNALGNATTHTWPVWSTEGGLLTPKGGKVEEHVGQYYRLWLAQNKLLPAKGCPQAGEVFTYANSLPRTIDTAKHFLVGAFPGCELPVVNRVEVGKMDPVFNPIVTAEVTDQFNQAAIDATNKSAGEGGLDGMNKRLKANYALIEKILDYKNGKTCQQDKVCDLASQPSKLVLSQGKEPGISGPLGLGSGVSDAFMLQYYEGLPEKDVAWGQVKTPEQWRQVEEFKNAAQKALFSSPQVGRNTSATTLQFISGVLDKSQAKTADQQAGQKARVTLMVGHDSNIAAFVSALKIKDFTLPGQYERTPIAGAVVFQRWHDKKTDKDLIKIEYVYPTAKQIRNNSTYSLKQPLHRTVLQSAGCPIDNKGFCSFDTFNQLLQETLKNQVVN